ncbi:hypothetical protein MCOR27_002061 [Pyricularia oryzae]|uniref:Uncharacterized protein n=2 Tax=Pyricularia TaxID=48558 RepID=A0ABQ8NM76_PYRGI|nr:hypothetical protein MCOR01_003807 [Pyricularia oryzae]KAI6299177.1 hypothetical protein MCOR33_004825 [Pyricularia grisea]KAI6260674.1 hypothetical protein MCOR19_003021 [Pyricularia oryzae]KAI6276156.1 hypothetical protein MCOR26_005712 [Pyricularia oryzae]KAI6286047.1 hypothetical protein MCOR27_002061 [Pyricularia oryzae]
MAPTCYPRRATDHYLRLSAHESQSSTTAHPSCQTRPPIVLGVSNVFRTVTVVNAPDASALDFGQGDVPSTMALEKGAKVAQTDLIAAQIEVLVHGRLRRRIASDSGQQACTGSARSPVGLSRSALWSRSVITRVWVRMEWLRAIHSGMATFLHVCGCHVWHVGTCVAVLLSLGSSLRWESIMKRRFGHLADLIQADKEALLEISASIK